MHHVCTTCAPRVHLYFHAHPKFAPGGRGMLSYHNNEGRSWPDHCSDIPIKYRCTRGAHVVHTCCTRAAHVLHTRLTREACARGSPVTTPQQRLWIQSRTRLGRDGKVMHARRLCVMCERSATTFLHDFKMPTEHRNKWADFRNPPVNTGLLATPVNTGLLPHHK